MNISKYFTILTNTKLFAHISKEELPSLFDAIPYKISVYSKNDIIFSEEDVCETLNIILDGSVEIQNIDALGRVLSIAEFNNGDIFGEMLLFSDNNQFPVTVISKEPTTVLHMHKDSVVKLCQGSSEFLYEYLRIISNKAMILNMKLREVTLKTIRQKICDFLLMQSKKQKKLNIELKITKKEWADKIGVQRPSLSRELIKMKDEGIIDYDKDVITIKDLDALEDCQS